MKAYALFALIVVCLALVRADDNKCDYSNFSDCFSAINGVLGINSKTAESQCPTDTCKNVRNDWKGCVKEFYTSDSLKKTLGVLGSIASSSIKAATLPYSIICEKDGSKYCYDEYRKAIGNDTLMNDFNCSKCGKKLTENYKTILNTMNDKDSEDYKEIKAQIDSTSFCDGAFTITIMKVSSVLIIGLASLFFMM